MDTASDVPQEATAAPAAAVESGRAPEAAAVESGRAPEVSEDIASLGALVRKLLRKLGLAALLLVITVCYVGLGGMVFSSLESPNEYSACNRSRELHLSNENATLELLHDIISRLDGVATYTPAKLIALQDSFRSLLDRYGESIVGNGYDPNRDCDLLGTEVYPLKWSFMPAALFSMTIISTIGYGNIAPVTSWGQFVCIPYAILGISIYFFFLATFGPLVSAALKGIYTVCCCCGCVIPKRRNKPSKQKLSHIDADPPSRPAETTAAAQPARGLISVRAAVESLDPEAVASTAREVVMSDSELRRPSAPHCQSTTSAASGADDSVGPGAAAAATSDANVDSPTLHSTNADGRMSVGRTRPLSKFGGGGSDSGRDDGGRVQTPSSASLLLGDSHSLNDPSTVATDEMTECDSRQKADHEAGKGTDKQVICYENSGVRDETSGQKVQSRTKIKDAAKAAEKEYKEAVEEEEAIAKERDELEPSLPLLLCIGIFAGILMVSGEFFRQFEKWDETESIYFSFVTLATIGLGDLVPGTRDDLTATEVTIGSLSGMLFILIGMAFVSVLFDLMARAAIADFTWLAKKCRRQADNRSSRAASPAPRR